jgi:hypothetical protein
MFYYVRFGVEPTPWPITLRASPRVVRVWTKKTNVLFGGFDWDDCVLDLSKLATNG